MSLRNLQTDLSKGLSPIYVFLGDEDLMVSKAAALVVEQGLVGGAAAFNHTVFAGAAEDAAQAFAVARTLPMMGPRRVVELRHVHETRGPVLEALLAYCQEPSPSTVLVVWGRKWPDASTPSAGGKKVDFGRRAENAAGKVGTVQRFRARDQDPHRFASEEAERLGVRLDRGAARTLVELVGRDLGRLRQELIKAADFVGEPGGLIDDDVLREVCSLLAEAEIWDLTDAVVRGRTRQALATTHRLMEHGAAAHYLLAMVSWQLRQLLQLQSAMVLGMSPKEAGIKGNPRKLQALQQVLQQRRLRPERVFARLAAANEAMNSHRAGGRRVFEGLILDLLAAGPAA
jgi:DNA polymerase III delta subunit